MTMKTAWESFKVDGAQLLDQVKKILEEGNARSIVIKQDGRRIAGGVVQIVPRRQ